MPTTPVNSYINLSTAAPLTMPELYSCQDINYMVEQLEKQNADLRAEMKIMQRYINELHDEHNTFKIADETNKKHLLDELNVALPYGVSVSTAERCVSDYETALKTRVLPTTFETAMDLGFEDFDTDELLRMKSEIEEELSKRNIARI